MGRNDYIKGIWHLLKAFSLVYKSNPKARLVVLGAGNWDGYKELAEKLGVGEAAFFPGNRKNPFAYVAKADLYVCSSNHEGFPNAVLEAMALKKPVISADCKTGPREILLSEAQYEELIAKQPDGSSIREVVHGEYGILVPDMSQEVDMNPDNISDEERTLAEAIKNVLDDKSEKDRLSQKANERALFYTPEKYKQSIHEIFKRYE